MKQWILILIIAVGNIEAYATPPRPQYLAISPKMGDGVWSLLKRYELHNAPVNTKLFYELNNLKTGSKIFKHKKYKLPILIYPYNGKSIRSSIGIKDYPKALSIQHYNERLTQKGVKPKSYRKSRILWVPQSYLSAAHPVKIAKAKEKRVLTVDLFGPRYKNVKIKSNQLKGQVFYVVSGHGGPDPGAIAHKVNNKYNLCEDEYAYDVALRLARKLMENGALVHVIIQDKNDGIRDGAWLSGDKDETCMGKKIPLSQLQRLKQRTQTINRLYKQHKRTGIQKHKVICIHVDSRSEHTNQDVFFYYYAKSASGHRIANNIYKTFRDKYRKHQKNRGYHGSISSRPLYLLKNTLPPAVYVELANIRNAKDRIRLVKPQNRDALAQWLFEGIIQ